MYLLIFLKFQIEVDRFSPDNESQNKKTLELKNGVIIQLK
jgi:hypothetical protein